MKYMGKCEKLLTLKCLSFALQCTIRRIKIVDILQHIICAYFYFIVLWIILLSENELLPRSFRKVILAVVMELTH